MRVTITDVIKETIKKATFTEENTWRIGSNPMYTLSVKADKAECKKLVAWAKKNASAARIVDENSERILVYISDPCMYQIEKFMENK